MRQNAFDDDDVGDERVGGVHIILDGARPTLDMTSLRAPSPLPPPPPCSIRLYVLKTRYRQPFAPRQPPCMRATGTTMTCTRVSDVRLFLNFRPLTGSRSLDFVQIIRRRWTVTHVCKTQRLLLSYRILMPFNARDRRFNINSLNPVSRRTAFDLYIIYGIRYVTQPVNYNIIVIISLFCDLISSAPIRSTAAA